MSYGSMPKIAQSCPSINSAIDLTDNMARIAEELSNLVSGTDDDAVYAAHNLVNDALDMQGRLTDYLEDIRSINSELRDAMTAIYHENNRLEAEIESLNGEVHFLENMLQ